MPLYFPREMDGFSLPDYDRLSSMHKKLLASRVPHY